MPFQATVEGELTIKNGKDVNIVFFTEEFILPDEVDTQSQARSIIQAGLLTDRLRRKHDNFRRWRTAEVVDFKRCQKTPENSELHKLLLEATKLGCVPEMIDSYRSEEDKIKAVKKAIGIAAKKKIKEPMVEVEGDAA